MVWTGSIWLEIGTSGGLVSKCFKITGRENMN
jgi:hypothetical protein